MSSTRPCFLKKPAFWPSSENEFSQVPARPAATRNVSSAQAARVRAATRMRADAARATLILSICVSFSGACWPCTHKYGPPSVAQCPRRPESDLLAAGQRNDAKCQERTHAPQQTASLFDDLVGECEQRRRHLEAKRPSGREIDGELELGRLLDLEVARLRAAQNLVHILGGAPEQVREVWSVGHETPGLDIVAGAPDRRQPRAERKRDDACSVGSSESSDHDVKRVGLGLERREGRCDILRPPDFEWRDFEAGRARA